MNYKIRDLFDKGFREKLMQRIKKYSIRLGRIFIVLIIISHFYYIGITPTESMYPTIQYGDLIVFERDISNLRRGDIVSFYSPLDNNTVYLKRIIGLPGDEIEIKDGYVFVNGQTLNEDYILEKPNYEFETMIIPDNSYFVLGDNRNNSLDSSDWGVIKNEVIKGRVKLILLPISRIKVFSYKNRTRNST